MEASGVVLCSGGFDPLHVGHLRYLEAAARHGPVTVALNSDEWLQRKKGYVFQGWDERCAILMGLRSVVDVESVEDSDGTVCEAIRRLMPAAFAKGGDRGPGNTPEAALCRELDIELIWGCGGVKAQSSSVLVARQWGFYEVLADRPGYKVKRLVLNPGTAISLQRHKLRSEHWVIMGRSMVTVDQSTWASNEESYIFIDRGVTHRLSNPGPSLLEVIEVQRGECREDDIERL